MVGANPIRFRSRAFSQSAYVQEQWTLEPADAAGRGALRLRQEHLPAPDVRRQQVPSAGPRLPDRHRGRHHRLPRHQPAPRRHLRPDRRRQDVGEVQRRPLHRLGVERRPLDARQPDEPHPDDGGPDLDRRQRQLRPRLRPAEPGGAEPDRRRAATSAARGTTTRSAPRCSAPPTTRTCSGAGTPARWTGSSARRCSGDPAPACRSRSAITAAGSTSGR